MGEFTDYWHALDRIKPFDIDISTKELGTSAKIGGDVLQSLKADITAGASHVEIGFTGTGKGMLGQGNTTPEMFGRDKREEIRQLAKINEVTTSTHASVGIPNLSGFTREGFSDMAARESINEMKRTIDFAADIGGGPVVVHAMEFPRQIRDFPEFRAGLGEKEEVVALADADTGQVFSLRKAREIRVPKLDIQYPKAKIGEKEEDIVKQEILKKYLDEKNVKLYDIKIKEKTPGSGEVDWVTISHDDVVEAVKRWNKEHIKPDEKKTPDKEYFMLLERAELERSKPYAYSYYQKAKELEKAANEHEKEAKEWAKLEKDKASIEFLKEDFRRRYEKLGIRLEKDELPSQALMKKAEELRRHAAAETEGWVGYSKQIERIERMREHIKPIAEYGLDTAANNYADVAIYAYEKEKQKKQKGEEIKTMFIAPENIFPEYYGAHPDELRDIVVKAREKMAERLIKEKHLSKQEAKKVAEEHIKATFDIGHAWTWKRFFSGSEEEFKDYVLNKAKELMEEGIIGHVHISDNFGYYDEHLTPGVGSAPVEDFIKELKKQGFKQPMIVEWGAQTDQEAYGAMLGTWARIASSPIYRVDSVQRTWGDIESGYFGRTSSPKFITAPYMHDKDAKNWGYWTWSETPIE